MTTTILVSVAETYEESTDVALVELRFPLSNIEAGLSPDQLLKLTEHVYPELERRGPADFDVLCLQYFINGVPVLHQSWSRYAPQRPGRNAVPDCLGQSLWLVNQGRPDLLAITL